MRSTRAAGLSTISLTPPRPPSEAEADAILGEGAANGTAEPTTDVTDGVVERNPADALGGGLTRPHDRGLG
jgi:hypothetical protein